MNKRRINVRGIVVRDGKILAVKHKNDDGTEQEYWAIPGGGLEDMETIADGVKREMFEELGVKVEVGKLLFVQQFISDREGYEEELELFFLVNSSESLENIDINKTSHGAIELSRVEFVDPKNSYILPVFLSEIDLKPYIDSDYSPYIYDDLSDSRPQGAL